MCDCRNQEDCHGSAYIEERSMGLGLSSIHSLLYHPVIYAASSFFRSLIRCFFIYSFPFCIIHSFAFQSNHQALLSLLPLLFFLLLWQASSRPMASPKRPVFLKNLRILQSTHIGTPFPWVIKNKGPGCILRDPCAPLCSLILRQKQKVAVDLNPSSAHDQTSLAAASGDEVMQLAEGAASGAERTASGDGAAQLVEGNGYHLNNLSNPSNFNLSLSYQ